MKKNKMKIIILIIVFIVAALFVRYIIVERRKNYEKTIKIHAESIIQTYLTQWRLAIINNDNEVKKCYQVNEEDSGETYFGSVYISDDEGYIWLTNGEYYIEGKKGNLYITKNNKIPTTNCEGKE